MSIIKMVTYRPMISTHWMTGASLGFQFDEHQIFDDRINDIVVMNSLVVYFFILEIIFYWDKKQEVLDE